MRDVLYCIDRPFMRKTFEAIDRHVDAPSAALPTHERAVGCTDALAEATVEDPAAIRENVRRVDPAVVVCNDTRPLRTLAEEVAYTTVHVRHGASVGRGEVDTTNRHALPHADLALAPGRLWVRAYRDDVAARVVGVPEADPLVAADPPRARRVLYAPTNHRYGGGSYIQTAEDVLEVFAGSAFDLVFRPHPHDRRQEPGRTVTARCRERIRDLPNVTFDDGSTPRASLLAADLLISDVSGIVTEWLHTGRPLVQLTDLASGRDVPRLGYRTADLDLETVASLYERGYPEPTAAMVARAREALGIPMDGRAGSRAAREVQACTA